MSKCLRTRARVKDSVYAAGAGLVYHQVGFGFDGSGYQNFLLAFDDHLFTNASIMVTVSFSNWSDVLATANFSADERNRHRVIINWFLGHLKREHQPATVDSAREFIDHLVETRNPAKWQVKQWTDGLNWSRKRLRLTRLRSL
ncbi:MAG: hypothetical protein ACSHYA_20090 [Opitutaceae bacterium]